MKEHIIIYLVLFLTIQLSAQDDVLSATFRGTRIVNGHSVETMKKGELEMIISHRFGRLNGGFYELFGLDQASIRIGFDYGLKNGINIGIGRSSLGKHYDAFTKIRLLSQNKNGFMTLCLFSSVAYKTLKSNNPDRPVFRQNRLAFTTQLLMASKLNDRISIQFMPTYLHYNLVEKKSDKNDVFSFGMGSRFKLTKNIALLVEYYYTPDNQRVSIQNQPLSLGVDINTGSHVFQLHFTNASSMIEKGFIGETSGRWAKGDIQLGFNITRTFKLQGRRY